MAQAPCKVFVEPEDLPIANTMAMTWAGLEPEAEHKDSTAAVAEVAEVAAVVEAAEAVEAAEVVEVVEVGICCVEGASGAVALALVVQAVGICSVVCSTEGIVEEAVGDDNSCAPSTTTTTTTKST
jgi:hypothetical protein